MSAYQIQDPRPSEKKKMQPAGFSTGAGKTTDSKSSARLPAQNAGISPVAEDVPPEGGLRAWLVVAGAACVFFSCLGFMNSFGVFQEYYMANQLRDKSPDAISWIGSLTAFIQFAAGVVSGPLFDRIGAWVRRVPPPFRR